MARKPPKPTKEKQTPTKGRKAKAPKRGALQPEEALVPSLLWKNRHAIVTYFYCNPTTGVITTTWQRIPDGNARELTARKKKPSAAYGFQFATRHIDARGDEHVDVQSQMYYVGCSVVSLGEVIARRLGSEAQQLVKLVSPRQLMVEIHKAGHYRMFRDGDQLFHDIDPTNPD